MNHGCDLGQGSRSEIGRRWAPLPDVRSAQVRWQFLVKSICAPPVQNIRGYQGPELRPV